MSLIVDALHREPKGEARDYSRRASRRGLPAERIIGIAAGAIALGFLAVALPAYWVARQTRPHQAAVRPLVRPMVRRPLRETLPTQNRILLEQNDASAEVHNNLGVAYLRARQLDDAAAELKVALDIDSRNIESQVNLALVQKAAGRTAEARDLLRRAVAQDPRHAGSHYNLAVVADEGGDMVTAVTHYRAFLRYGAVGYPDLAARVRSRLTTLESG